jgi:hypothetical protein
MPLLYLMIAAQGALGYGLTSVIGAVVAEIFQGKHYGSIFGTLMLAAIAAAPSGPGSPARAARRAGKLHACRLDRRRAERAIGVGDSGAPRPARYAPSPARCIGSRLALDPAGHGSGGNQAGLANDGRHESRAQKRPGLKAEESLGLVGRCRASTNRKACGS